MENAAELESQLVESLNSMATIKRFSIENFSNLKTETKFIKFLKCLRPKRSNWIWRPAR